MGWAAGSQLGPPLYMSPEHPTNQTNQQQGQAGEPQPSPQASCSLSPEPPLSPAPGTMVRCYTRSRSGRPLQVHSLKSGEGQEQEQRLNPEQEEACGRTHRGRQCRGRCCSQRRLYGIHGRRRRRQSCGRRRRCTCRRPRRRGCRRRRTSYRRYH
ncbi:protamine-2 isoform X2 [Fukomys damarensis]|uniref:protamine-2 isoform X2 n=1 Tax=Fukomys damarensis TaxID=885580 RepID=UPI00053FD95A|nr:protamine-2 isoform X2 [Fukomys damarensis]